MAHAHGHQHHGHSHGPASYGRAFAIGMALNIGFVIIEAVYGKLAGSLALVADAGHNLSDVLGLGLAWGAAVLAQRRPTVRRTYGLRRTSILAALANAIILLVAVGGIAWEAIRRLQTPDHVGGVTVIWVAAIGIVVNIGTALLFLRGRHTDLNIRGAFLHMAADAAVSLGVVLAGIAIVLTGQGWIDPAVSLAIVVVILAGTWGLLRDSVNLALDAVPEQIDVAAVESYLRALPQVQDVHDLHIWAMSTTETALTAHLVRPASALDDGLLARASAELHDRFGIEHATLQVETGDPAHPCACCLLGSQVASPQVAIRS
ncbi:MAG: cation diffusion facilitator family transporter [Thermomicrobiales bacterium]